MHLLEINPTTKDVRVQSFPRTGIEMAADRYLEAEKAAQKAGGGAQALLVSADSLAALKRAYPAYSGDSKAFLRALEKATSDA